MYIFVGTSGLLVADQGLVMDVTMIFGWALFTEARDMGNYTACVVIVMCEVGYIAVLGLFFKKIIVQSHEN